MNKDEELPPGDIWAHLLRKHNWNIDKAWQDWLKIKQQGL